MSDLTIMDVDTHLLEGPRPWLLVRVETDAGVTGIGEVPRKRHTPADVERLAERLVGADPFETERLFGAGGALGAAPNDVFTTTITGGLDMACWDVKGKHLGVPVHELLGGKVRNELRAYANGWDFDARSVVDRYHDGEDAASVLPDVKAEITDAAVGMVEAGYDALKFSPVQWGRGSTTSRRELDCALAVVEAVAESVPSHVELLVEGHKRLSTDKAVTAARRLERFDPGFYEEPVPAELEPLRRVADQSPVPIATGESFVTHRGFADLLSRSDVRVVQPDVGRAGGITELLKIANMAAAERVGFAPHNAAGPVMTHAAVHVGAASPAFMIQETFEAAFHPDWSEELLVDPLDIGDGTIAVPDRPGLGVELDETVLEEHEIGVEDL
jgi:galactonate dehydratase